MAIMSTAPRTRSPGADEAPGMARSDAGRQEDNAEPLDVGACPPRFRFALSSITCLCHRADEGFSCKLNDPHPALRTPYALSPLTRGEGKRETGLNGEDSDRSRRCAVRVDDGRAGACHLVSRHPLSGV